jgi:hypothetical protein
VREKLGNDNEKHVEAGVAEGREAGWVIKGALFGAD